VEILGGATDGSAWRLLYGDAIRQSGSTVPTGETSGGEYISPRHAARHPGGKYMDTVSHGIIFWLIIGGIAGALAGRIVDGGGFGIVVDIIIGIVGAFIGGWLGGVLGIHLGGGIIGSLITALIGAVILLFIVRLFSRGRTV
jgi:uncharacterized membrane protein YeaQ/YmgE (transglycosylase-associated protein family)